MPELPWVKWFPADWASDPMLSMCDIASQGVWMNAVNAMLLTNQPRIEGTLDELAKVCRCRRHQLEGALAELKCKKVGNIFEQNGNTIIECRRLLRSFKIKYLKRKAGLASATQRANMEPTPSASASEYASEYASGKGGAGGKGTSPEFTALRIANRIMAGDPPWYYDNCKVDLDKLSSASLKTVILPFVAVPEQNILSAWVNAARLAHGAKVDGLAKDATAYAIQIFKNRLIEAQTKPNDS